MAEDGYCELSDEDVVESENEGIGSRGDGVGTERSGQ